MYNIIYEIVLINLIKGYLIRRANSFSQQQVELVDTPLFFPPGLEKIFLVIYIITLPYIAGLMFLFFYVAEGRAEFFLSINNDSSFILTWAIGYEILAVLAIILIIKSAIFFSIKNSKGGREKFQRP